MFEKLLNLIGTDKVLHFLSGIVISFIIGNVLMIQEGGTGATCIVFSAVGLVVAVFCAFFKCVLFDTSFEWEKFVATIAGGVLPVAVNAIGAVFNVLSN